MYVCMHACMYVCIDIYIDVCVCVICVYLYIPIYPMLSYGKIGTKTTLIGYFRLMQLIQPFFGWDRSTGGPPSTALKTTYQTPTNKDPAKSWVLVGRCWKSVQLRPERPQSHDLKPMQRLSRAQGLGDSVVTRDLPGIYKGLEGVLRIWRISG